MSSDHRWSGSFYAVTRGSGGVGAGPTLGGTQAGVRLYRALGRGVAATASLAGSPGEQGSREATLGVAWRRGQAGVIAERSVPIDGGVAGFRLLAFAGLARSLPAGLRLEGYGQAGVTRIGGFADGAVGIERSIARRRDTEMSVGMGGWASIQRGARRIDIGPQLVARVPVAARRVRVSAEWRMRVAGNAAPNSGPSVTVGTDF